MKIFGLPRLSALGGSTFLAGMAMAVCFAVISSLPTLRGPPVVSFLAYFSIAGLAYGLSVVRLPWDRPPIWVIWSFALIFRLSLLFTSPTLSTDVFRYIWDGHLLGLGVNPYALPVNSPYLDAYHIPVRAHVDHAWMASPYLPSAQLLFALVYLLSPGSTLAFQLAAVLLDLLTALLVMDLLTRVELPRWAVLVYLWNPLVILEFSHGAHVDALMVFLITTSFWLLVAGRKSFSALVLAAATLTKGLPILIVPVLARRWGWRRLLLYAGAILVGLALFAAGAGWGLTGPMDGRGVFGAIRIYLSQWNFNSSLYHWIEVWLTGYPTSGAVPRQLTDPGLIQLARLISLGLLIIPASMAFWSAWRGDTPQHGGIAGRNLILLRLAVIPGAAYLVTTPTLHPWYLTLITPLLPFFLTRRERSFRFEPLVWSWLYLSVAIAFSYLTYIDPQNPREFALVRQVEYLPFYGLLVWGLMPSINRTIQQMMEQNRSDE